MTRHAVPDAPVVSGRRAVIAVLQAALAALGLVLSLPSGAGQARAAGVSAAATVCCGGELRAPDDTSARNPGTLPAHIGRLHARPWTSLGERAGGRAAGHQQDADSGVAASAGRLRHHGRGAADVAVADVTGLSFRPAPGDPARAPPS